MSIKLVMPANHLNLCHPRRGKSKFERAYQLIGIHDSNHHYLVFLPQFPRAQRHHDIMEGNADVCQAPAAPLSPCLICGDISTPALMHMSVTWKAFRISPMPHLPTTAPESQGKGPGQRHLLDVSLCFSTRRPQRSLLTWKASASMTPSSTTAS